MAQKKYIVESDTLLFPFLMEILKGKSRTTVKSVLTHRQVEINRQVSTQFDAPLKTGDTVTIFDEKRVDELRHPMMRIVYEDECLIVIDKKSGLLSMGTDRERDKTAFYILSQHVKQVDRENRIFILHRLDRDTSGLMMFAKSEKIKIEMQSAWETVVTERKYVAVAEGRMPRSEGVISTYLTENKGYKVFVSNKNVGDPAVTSYKVIKSNDIYTLLELELSTGKKNQIRAHLEYIGFSIVGDKKYGAKSNPIARVALHASKLSFIHPTNGEQMCFTSPIPGKFESLFKL